MSTLVTLISSGTALLMAGIVASYSGAEMLVEDVSRLAISLNLQAAIVGMTIVTFTTTTPELFVAVLNGLGYSSDPGLGTIIGSNIANVGPVLGISALIEPMGILTTAFRRHVPFMIAAAAVLVALGMDGNLSAIDGGILLLILATFMGYLLYRTQSATADAIGADKIDTEDKDEVPAQFKDVAYLAFGLLLLFIGSNWFIQGGQGPFGSLGFGPRFIRLTVLAFDTSLPGPTASVISAARGESESSIGNVVGSNTYSVAAAFGILAIMVPVNAPSNTISLDFPAFLVLAFGIIAPMLRNCDVSRLDGSTFVVGCLVFF